MLELFAKDYSFIGIYLKKIQAQEVIFQEQLNDVGNESIVRV